MDSKTTRCLLYAAISVLIIVNCAVVIQRKVIASPKTYSHVGIRDAPSSPHFSPGLPPLLAIADIVLLSIIAILLLSLSGSEEVSEAGRGKVRRMIEESEFTRGERLEYNVYKELIKGQPFQQCHMDGDSPMCCYRESGYIRRCIKYPAPSERIAENVIALIETGPIDRLTRKIKQWWKWLIERF